LFVDGESELTGLVLKCAVDVHEDLGPGLLESAYQSCMADALEQLGLRVEQEVRLPLVFRNRKLDAAYRIDLLVEERVIVELKSVRELEPIHTAQMLTYLRLSGLEVGLLINFNVVLLKNGIRRVVLNAGKAKQAQNTLGPRAEGPPLPGPLREAPRSPHLRGESLGFTP
jgi:GxxExxY protein